MKKINLKFIAESAIIAALYAAITWAFAPISYEGIQFRISEILILLVVLNPKFAFALILGCFIANTTSSLGWYDYVFGTLATTIAIIPMCFVRKMPIAAIAPVISNAFIVGLELVLALNQPWSLYFFNVLTVGLGEAVVLYFLGIPAMSAICKNEALVSLMELDKDHTIEFKFINGYSLLGIALAILNIIFFIAYPLYYEGENGYSMLNIATNGSYWLFIIIVLAVSYGVINVFLKKKLKLMLNSILILSITAIYISLGIINTICFKNYLYYLFFIFPPLMIIHAVQFYKYDLRKENTIEDTNDIDVETIE